MTAWPCWERSQLDFSAEAWASKLLSTGFITMNEHWWLLYCSLCEFMKFSRAAKATGSRPARKYNPRKRPEEDCHKCRKYREDDNWQVDVRSFCWPFMLLFVETLCLQECVLCRRSYHTKCLEEWKKTTLNEFFLCLPCFEIEAEKGFGPEWWNLTTKIWKVGFLLQSKGRCYKNEVSGF